MERKNNGQIKGLISNLWLADSFIHRTPLLPNFVQNFKTLSQVVPEKSLTEKVNRQKYKHCDRKIKNNIPPMYFVCRVYNDAAVANVAAVAGVNNAVVAVINVVEVVNVAAVAVVNVAEAAPIHIAAVAFVNVAAIAVVNIAAVEVVNVAAVALIKVAELTDYLP